MSNQKRNLDSTELDVSNAESFVNNPDGEQDTNEELGFPPQDEIHAGDWEGRL